MATATGQRASNLLVRLQKKGGLGKKLRRVGRSGNRASGLWAFLPIALPPPTRGSLLCRRNGLEGKAHKPETSRERRTICANGATVGGFRANWNHDAAPPANSIGLIGVLKGLYAGRISGVRRGQLTKGDNSLIVGGVETVDVRPREFGGWVVSCSWG